MVRHSEGKFLFAVASDFLVCSVFWETVAVKKFVFRENWVGSILAG